MAMLTFVFYWPTIQGQQKRRRTLLISLGSGGHTTEMLLLLQNVDVQAFQRIYYVSSGDTLSIRHARDYESRLMHGAVFSQSDVSKSAGVEANTLIRTLPRARRVGQSWFSTVFTTTRSLASAVQYVYKDQPDLVICNGPGTCVMLVIAVLLFRVRHHRSRGLHALLMNNRLCASSNAGPSLSRASPE